MSAISSSQQPQKITFFLGRKQQAKHDITEYIGQSPNLKQVQMP
jgi:hypothetical protein